MLWYMSKWHFLLFTYNEKTIMSSSSSPKTSGKFKIPYTSTHQFFHWKRENHPTMVQTPTQFPASCKMKDLQNHPLKICNKKNGLFLSMNARQCSMHLVQVYFDWYSIIPNLCQFYSMIFQTSKRYKIIFCFILLSPTFYKVDIKIFFSYIVIETWRKYTAQ